MPFSVGPRDAGGYFACDTEQAIMITRLLIDTGVNNIEIITYKEDKTGIQARFAVELRLGATVLLLIVAVSNWLVNRWEGAAFLAAYAAYLGYLAHIA